MAKPKRKTLYKIELMAREDLLDFEAIVSKSGKRIGSAGSEDLHAAVLLSVATVMEDFWEGQK